MPGVPKITVTQLKELLRENNMTTTGTKAELIYRLQEFNPTILDNLETEEEDEYQDGIDNVVGASNTQSNENKELELLRRENSVLLREMEVMRREQNLSRASADTGHVDHARKEKIKIQELREWVEAYEGSDDFESWKERIEVIKNTHEMNETMTRTLICSTLKGRALKWFKSKVEHLTMPTSQLLQAMDAFFNTESCKEAQEKKFEERKWQPQETFPEYYHNKVILGNRIKMEEEKMLKKIINGIEDLQLQNQAKTLRFRNKEELLQAFQDVKLTKEKGKIPTKTDHGDTQRKSKTQSEQQIVCYNCQETGHIATKCTKPKRERNACFNCNSTLHRIKDCPERRRETTADNSALVVQQMQLTPPYMVNVSFNINETENLLLPAMIDSGSPISLVKEKYIPRNIRTPIELSNCHFVGLNNSRLKVTETFETDVEVWKGKIKLKLFVVPNETMGFSMILGRDFVASPLINGDLNIYSKGSSEEENAWRELRNIHCIDTTTDIDEQLRINKNISIDDKKKLQKLYKERYVKIFNENEQTDEYEMNINVNNEQPISFRPRRLSFSDKEKLRVLLDDLIKRKIIRSSDSPYASPIVLVRKKSGEIRLCVDYRELNKITIKDNYPTQLIEDNLDRLKNKKYFTALDLRDGFFHIKMAESAIKYTSFVTPLGQFEYLRCPFGLTNGPKVFIRYVNRIFDQLMRENKVLLYADDILVATETMKEHLEILEQVFELAGKNRLAFRLDKCSFAENEINYLGYQVDSAGIRASNENVQAVKNYPVPRNAKEVHRFVALASYFRKFIKNFALIAKPLYELIKKNNVFKFGAKETESFEEIKNCLASSVVLAIYSPHLETELHCDASASGFGAILLQKQKDHLWKPVFYFSQRTTSAEEKYHSFELECLAAIYAIKRFHVYLSGVKFKIITDCDSFRYMLDKKDVNPRISRWALFLQNYEYEIEHRAGSRMGHVDALSRCNAVLVIEGNTVERTLAVKQNGDKKISIVRDELEKNESKLFELRDGLVYRKDKTRGLLFYVPESMEANVIRASHDDLGHFGIKKVVENVKRTYWFPDMNKKVKEYISNCLKCIEFAPTSGKQGELHSLEKGSLPFLTIHADHIGPFERTRQGFKYLLVIVDGFTKFSKLYPCKSITTEETIKYLNEFFRNYSQPRRLITDRGTAFTSESFKNFMTDNLIEHVLIAVGTPRANGQVERINRTITPTIAKLKETVKDWDKVVGEVEFALNNTISCTTGKCPSELLFGLKQKRKINDIIREQLESRGNESMQELRETAKINIEKSQMNNKRLYDRKQGNAHKYKTGDYVMIKNIDTTVNTNKKLIPKFKGPYVITKCLDKDRYVINDIEGFEVTQMPYTGIVAPDRMRPYIKT